MNKLIRLHMVFVVLFFTNLSWAQDANQALSTVEKTFSSVLNKLHDNKVQYQSDHKALFDMINGEMLPIVDEKLMARYVLGKNWKSATKQQQTDFINVFKQQIFKSHAMSLLDFHDTTIKYGKLSEVKKKRTKIKLLIEGSGDEKYPVELSLRFTKGQWYIYDASLEGLSIIVSLRGSIGDEVNKKGIQMVIDELNQ